MSDLCNRAKVVVKPLSEALYKFANSNIPVVLWQVLVDDCEIHFTHAFKELTGPQALYEKVYAPLHAAVSGLERRDYIVISGGVNDKVGFGFAGFYSAVFEQAWLDIPPSKHVVQMRLHEFVLRIGW